MKHARADYDRIQDPAGLIGEDEPVFLIRAQDTNAPAAVRRYADLARASGASEAFIEACDDQAAAMEQWQQTHEPIAPTGKVPDMPGDPAHDAAATVTEIAAPYEPEVKWLPKVPDMPGDRVVKELERLTEKLYAEQPDTTATLAELLRFLKTVLGGAER